MSNLPKIILSLAAMTAATSMLIDSLSSAHAISGPHISRRQPFGQRLHQLQWPSRYDVFSTSSHDFIMTDIIIYNGSVRLNIGVSGSGTRKVCGWVRLMGPISKPFLCNQGLIPAGRPVLYRCQLLSGSSLLHPLVLAVFCLR